MFYNAYLGKIKESVDLENVNNVFDILHYLSGSLSSSRAFGGDIPTKKLGLKKYLLDYDSYLYVGTKERIMDCLKYVGVDLNYSDRMKDGLEYAILVIIEEYGETQIKEAEEAENYWSITENKIF